MLTLVLYLHECIFQGFLHIDEYPPDANQGFDIPSALVTFPEFNSSRSYPEGDTLFVSPLLQTFKVYLVT